MLTQTQLSWVKAHCCRHVLLPVCMSLLFILLHAKNTSKSPSLVSCCEAWKHAQTVGPSVRCDQILTCIWLISRARCPGRELKISALKAVCTCPRRWLRGSGGHLLCSLNTEALGNNWTKTEMRDSDCPELKFGLVLDLRDFKLFCPVTPKNWGLYKLHVRVADDFT